MKDLLEDLQSCEEAIQATEKYIREDRTPAGISIILDDEKRRVYSTAIISCYELGKDDRSYWDKAFEYVEKVKARPILQALGNPEVRWSAFASEPLYDEYKRIASEVSALFVERSRGKSVDDEIRELSRALDQVMWRIQRPAATYAKPVEPVNVETVKSFLKRFPDMTLVDYFVTGDSVLGFAVTADGVVDALRTDFGPSGLEGPVWHLYTMIEQYRKWTEVQQRTTWASFLSPSNLFRLYDDLFKPLENALLGKNLIYFLPDSVLYYLPFHALCYREKQGVKFVIDSHDAAYAPSASVLKLLVERSEKRNVQRGKGLKSCFALAGPGLLYGKEEAEEVAKIFEAKPKKGTIGSLFEEKTIVKAWDLKKMVPIAEAKKRITSSDLQAADIVHLSCHSQMSSFSSVSALKLEDSDLTVEDICRLRLNASLVTLSACETQRSDIVTGRELAGFVGAFLQAGPPTVISSLWKVDGRSTKMLMELMYPNLKNGVTKVKALNEAQRALKSRLEEGEKVFICPYFWAPFVLVGSYF